jgi:hypothetical protein
MVRDNPSQGERLSVDVSLEAQEGGCRFARRQNADEQKRWNGRARKVPSLAVALASGDVNPTLTMLCHCHCWSMRPWESMRGQKFVGEARTLGIAWTRTPALQELVNKGETS